MKKLVKDLLNRFGYAVIRKGKVGVPEEKYLFLLHAFADLVRAGGLPSLPSLRREQGLLAAQLTGITEAQALYLLDALNASLGLDGDVCEFGVAQGATSAFIAEAMGAANKRLWLFDSFEGLPSPTGKDQLKDDVLGLGSMEQYKGQMSFPESMVRRRLAAIGFPKERTEVVAGFVEASIGAGRTPKQVAFAFVDLDFYDPILAVLKYLDGVLVCGAAVMVHDYGFFSTGAKDAVDEFLQSHPNRYAAHFPEGPVTHCCLLRRLGNSIE